MNDLYYFMIINISTFIFFILSILIRHYRNSDFNLLKKKVASNIDIWKIGHFIHYSLLGIYSKSLWFTTLLGSIIFEAFEQTCSEYSKFIYAHSDIDPIINTIGFLFGLIINNLLS